MGVGPHALAGPHQALKAQHRGVDGAVSGIDEDVVQEPAKRAAAEWSNHGNLQCMVSNDESCIITAKRGDTGEGENTTYPEIVTTCGPHFMAISNHERHQSGTKVTSKVDGITSLPTEAGTNTKDEEEEAERHQVSSSNVVRVGQGEDAEHEDAAGNEFGEEHACPGHESGRVCAKDASGSGRASHGSDTGAPFKGIESRLVVGIHDGSASHGSEELGKGIDGELSPRVTAVETVGKGHRWVEVTAGLSANIDAKHDSDSIWTNTVSDKVLNMVYRNATYPHPQEMLW